MVRRKGVLLFLILMITALLASCVPDQSTHDIEDTIQNGGAYEVDINSEKVEEEKEDSDNEEKLKVLSIYKLEAETLNLEEDLEEIIEEVHNLGGYVGSNNVKGKEVNSSSSTVESELTLRVPNDKVKDAVNIIKEISSVQSESLSSVDITDTYYDVEARIAGLEVREKRLQELYKETDNIKDIIEIDEKLAEIEEAKEEEVRRKYKMDKRISFSRIDVNLKEVSRLTESNNGNITYGEKLSQAFSSAGTMVADMIIGALSFIIKYSPVIALIALGVYVYAKCIFPKLKTQSENKEKDNDEKYE